MSDTRSFAHSFLAAAALLLPLLSLPPSAGEDASAAVTLDRQAAPLEQVLGDVDRQAHLRLGATHETRWTPLSLHVRERPAERVRAELATLFNYTWVREAGDRSGRVTLSQEREAREGRQALALRWYARPIDLLLDYAALKTRDPGRKALPPAPPGADPDDPRFVPEPLDRRDDPGRYAALKLLQSLSRSQLLTVVTGGLYLRWREMQPEQRAPALALAADVGASQSERMGSPAEAERRLREMGLRLEAAIWPHVNAPSAYSVLLGPALLEFNEFDSTYLDHPRATPARGVRGTPYTPRRANPRPAPADYGDLERMPFPAAGFREQFPATWAQIFHQLAQRLPFALYSDCLFDPPLGIDPAREAKGSDGPHNPSPVAVEGRSVAAVLDALCARYGQVWWRSGDALFFRDATWFLDEEYQVPPALLASLADQITARGGLDERGVDLLASLTQKQTQGMDRLVQSLKKRVQWPSADRAYRLLQAYSTLSTDQKRRVLALGLPADEMSPAQRFAYREALFLCTAPGEMVDSPPPLQFEQSLLPGAADGRPELSELAFYVRSLETLVDSEKGPRRWRPRLGSLTIPLLTPESALTDPADPR